MDKMAYLRAMGVPVWVARTTHKTQHESCVRALHSKTGQHVGCLLGSWAANERPLLDRMLKAIDLILIEAPQCFEENPLLPTLLLGADKRASICVGDRCVIGVAGRQVWCLPTLSTLIDQPAQKALAWQVLKDFRQMIKT